MTAHESHPSPGGGEQADAASAQAPQASDAVRIERQHNAKWGHYLEATIQRNNRVFCKKFPEQRHGGEQATMQLAQAWCDAIIAKYPLKSLAHYCSIVRSTNTSGTPGVYFRNSLQYHDNRQPSRYGYWVAVIPLANGTTRRRTFAVSCYGEEEARQCALEARQQALADLENVAPRKARHSVPPGVLDDLAKWKASMDAPGADVSGLLAEIDSKRQGAAQSAPDLEAQAQAAHESEAPADLTQSGEQHIARYETRGGTSCYWAVGIERRGKNYNKCFSDSTWGGAAAALEAAKAWRNETLRAHPVITKVQAVTNLHANNTSGVSGVFFKDTDYWAETGERWTAVSPKRRGERQRSESFSVDEYGERQAFALAVKAREAFVAELPDIPHFRRHVGDPPRAAPAGAPKAEPASAPLPRPASLPAPAPHGAAKLLDAAKAKLGIDSDFALSSVLGIAPPVMSKLRNGRLAPDMSLLIRLCDAAGMEVEAMKDLLGAAK